MAVYQGQQFISAIFDMVISHTRISNGICREETNSHTTAFPAEARANKHRVCALLYVEVLSDDELHRFLMMVLGGKGRPSRSTQTTRETIYFRAYLSSDEHLSSRGVPSPPPLNLPSQSCTGCKPFQPKACSRGGLPAGRR